MRVVVKQGEANEGEMIAELKELEREVNEERCRKLSWFFGSRPESIPLPGSKLGHIVFHLTHFSLS